MTFLTRLCLTLSLAIAVWAAPSHAQSISMDFDTSETYESVLTAATNGDIDEAETLMERLEREHEGTAEYHFVLGQIDMFKINEASAFRAPFIARSMRKNWEQALEIDPNFEPAAFSLGMFYAAAPGIVGGDKDKARELLARLEEMDSDYQHPFNVAMIGLADAETEEQQAQRNNDLAAAFDEWAVAMPNELSPRVSAASLHINEKNWEQAERYLKEADDIIAQDETLEKSEIYSVDYQWGKYAAESGLALEKGRDRLLALIQLEEHPEGLREGYSHFRLAQIFNHLNLEQAKDLHLVKAQELASEDEQLQTAIDEFLLENQNIAG
ncbi:MULTISPECIES: lipopolysaccharide assembly protein LapB [Gammaproteobacteria]|uniref:tetratricopeptide repeat protein n=1 Tax=Gammaproteobacteria TaxID=1236 RepID=UPI000DCFC178|nr:MULTISPECIES: hypothetical protein [Gammaproteobacteria]RTE86536.1 hypothetical protein DQX04_08240 [Aliidiomarina sp. B3213]TCZ90909.1 hypothetical protein EYQ95_08805 [Lysobacter sp. N42]